MSMVRIPGGIWAPRFFSRFLSSANPLTATDTGLIDADQEEYQVIGRVSLASGSGSKTFGNSGSAIGWFPGASITFAVNSTVTVGMKKTTIDLANGPPARATIGKAAFDVYKDLVGGTDTITSTTWLNTPMATLAAGGAITVTHGDLVCISFLLTTTGGTPSIKIRENSTNTLLMGAPTCTQVTSGPTYAATQGLPNLIITFDDSTVGWIDTSDVFSNTGLETIGSGNLYGNIIQFPFPCKVDAVCGSLGIAGTTNHDFGLYSTPLGTPAPVTGGVISIDPQTVGSTGSLWYIFPLPQEISIPANTAYAVAAKQNSANALAVQWSDVAAASHWQANSLDSNTFAAKSTAGGAFAAQNSGLRRGAMYVRISQLDTAARYKPVMRTG